MKISDLTVVIVDDEPLVRRGIRTVLADEDGVRVVAEAGNGRAAIEMIEQHRPDLLFLDVHMPEMDGFEVLAAVPDATRPAVVFVTAFDEYALRAFDVCALDYLLKPFDDDRLRTALARARQRIAESDSTFSLAAVLKELNTTQRTERIAVRTGDRISYVSVDDIEWCEAADNYVKIHTPNQRHLIRETVTGLARRLDPERFIRVHRSSIVNITCVRELRSHPSGDGDILLSSGATVRLSRSYRCDFEGRLSGQG